MRTQMINRAFRAVLALYLTMSMAASIGAAKSRTPATDFLRKSVSEVLTITANIVIEGKASSTLSC